MPRWADAGETVASGGRKVRTGEEEGRKRRGRGLRKRLEVRPLPHLGVYNSLYSATMWIPGRVTAQPFLKLLHWEGFAEIINC